MEVQCNLVIRKVLYTGKNVYCEGSLLSYISVSVFVFHMYLHTYLLSYVCILSSMFVVSIICTCSSMDKVIYFVFCMSFCRFVGIVCFVIF